MPPRRPPTPLPLIDDVVAEIFLRLPPDEPEHLFRAALVCKPWLRILCDAGFLRRYRAFHGAPPLLGLLHRLQVLEGDSPPRFASTTSMPDFPHPGSDGGRTRPVDCRHGRVLIHMLEDESVDLLVWDPITGERHAVPEPDIDWRARVYTAAVLCAADRCDHLHCNGGPFRLVFLATEHDDAQVNATVYSLVTGVWSAPVSFHDGCEFYAKHWYMTAQRGYYFPYLQPKRLAIIGDEIYFALSRNTAIAKYDCGKNCLCVTNPPPPDTEVYCAMIALTVMDGNSLGLAGIEDSNLHLWTRNVKGAAEWVQCRVIDLDNIVPMPTSGGSDGADVFGFAEGLDVIFIQTNAGLFMFDLKSGLVKKVGETGVYYSVLPYMSFCTPDRGTFLALASGEAH